ncbi:MAG: AMP-binding protein [Bacteroidales bacterium]|nr:AMP-binding protein [Bacteroidales bacterium]
MAETLKEFLAEWHSGSDVVLAHTSGSTGTPKEIRLLKSDMAQSAAATCRFFGIGPWSVIAAPLSVSYIAGKMMAVRAEVSGARLLELPVSNEVKVTEPVDLLAVVPSQLPSLLTDPEAPALVRNLLIGGAAPSAQVCRQLTEDGFRAFISYGMTETCSQVALASAADPERVFMAMPDVTFATDSRACLTVIAPKFSFKALQTNDVVELLDERRFRWRGRADGVINSGALKFFPEELEALYAPALAGREYYVVGVPDEKWGQVICLVVEGCTLGIAERLEDVVTDRRRLPKHIVSVRTLPRTSNGKIRRLSEIFS